MSEVLPNPKVGSAGDTRAPGPATPPLGASSAPAELPQEFGRYRIVRRLGRGGMGSVYLADDTQLGRQVALKVPHFADTDGPQVLERFYREARAAATLNHPHICPVFDVGDVAGVPYLTMAYVEGRPLSEIVRGGKPLPPARVAALVRKLALALHEAHQKGVVHRDLKPANVMVNQRGEPVVMDFGLARLAGKGETRLTQSGSVLGTPAYMAPEQVRGEVEALGPACDVYSLGVILYELLAGRLPYEGEVMAVLVQIALQEPQPPSAYRPGVDARLEAICRKAMARQPADRFESMAAFARALTEYLRSTLQPGSVPPGGFATAVSAAGRADESQTAVNVSGPAAPRRRLPWLGAAVAVGAAALVLVGVFLYVKQRGRTAPAGNAEPPAPAPAAGPAPAEGPVNLLGLIDLQSHFVSGAWTMTGGVLESPPGHGRYLQVPYAPPDEYRLEMAAERTGPHEALNLGIRLGGRQVEVSLDNGRDNPIAGLSLLDAKFAKENETGRRGRVFADNRPTTIVCTVRRDGLAVTADGRPLFDWKGSPQRLAVAPSHMVPDPRALFVGTWTTFRITKLELTPLGGPGERLGEGTGEVRRFHFSGPVHSAALAPDGRLVSAAGPDRAFVFAETATGVRTGVAEGHRGPANGVAFAPDSRRVLTAGQDGSVRLWDAQTHRQLRQFRGHRGAATCVAVTPDGRHGLSGGVDGVLRLWELPEPAAVPEPGHGLASPELPPGSPNGLTAEFHDDGRFLKRVAARIDAQIDWACEHVSPHPAVSPAKFAVRWYGWIKAPAPGRYRLCFYADDGARLWLDDRLLLDGWRRVARERLVHRAIEVDLADRPHALRIEYHQDAGAAAMTFRWQQKGAFAEETVPAEALFHDEAAARRVAVRRPTELRVFEGHRGAVLAVAVSADGRLAASGDQDAVRVWDLRTGVLVCRLEGHGGPVRGVAFTPDGGRLLVAGQAAVRVWDLSARAEVGRLVGHTLATTAVAAAPDGRQALSAGEDGTVRLWDLDTGKELRAFAGHQGRVAAAAFFPDGRRALSGGADRTARVWALPY